MNEEKYVGVIEQTEEQKKGNYAFAEIVASANPVQWHEKKQPSGLNFIYNDKTWRKFPVRNQDGSGTCVAQTFAKLMGILAYLKWGIFIVFSAGHIYIRRVNKTWGNGEGMVADDVYKIGQQGVTLEEFMPSQNMSEQQINALYENDLHKQVNLKIGNYIFLPVGDIEAIASVIQTTKKGVMTWYRFWNKEWNAVPVVISANPPSHHSVAGVDHTLYDKEKSLVIDESWGNTYGFEGQRVIKESWHKERNTHASYPMDFQFNSDTVPQPDKETFNKDLEFIALDSNTQQVLASLVGKHEAQKSDVIRLQDILKKEGLFPTNISSTGLFHNLTKKAVQAFQVKYLIAGPNDAGYGRVGPKTRAKLNALYA
jgi:hypothetical protein